MQSLAGDVFHIGIVEVVAGQGESEMFHMDAYLMSAACFQCDQDQAVPVLFREDPVMGDGRFTVLKIYDAQDAGARSARQRRADGTLPGAHMSPGNGEVIPSDFAAGRHGRKDAGADKMFGDED